MYSKGELMKDNIIELVQEEASYYLKFKKYNFKALAQIGKNGLTLKHKEGDKKTQMGIFELGIALGTHKKEEVNTKVSYLRINKNMYWIDDVNSEYYNQLIDSSTIKTGWKSGEHLIEFSNQYEYAIEIKTNPQNIKGRGSAMFVHCFGENPYTAGCIAIDRQKMLELLRLVDKYTKIKI